MFHSHHQPASQQAFQQQILKTRLSTPLVSKAFPFTLSTSSSCGGEVLWFNDGLEILSFFCLYDQLQVDVDKFSNLYNLSICLEIENFDVHVGVDGSRA